LVDEANPDQDEAEDDVGERSQDTAQPGEIAKKNVADGQRDENDRDGARFERVNRSK
jgi:hypothetical protein